MNLRSLSYIVLVFLSDDLTLSYFTTVDKIAALPDNLISITLHVISSCPYLFRTILMKLKVKSFFSLVNINFRETNYYYF